MAGRYVAGRDLAITMAPRAEARAALRSLPSANPEFVGRLDRIAEIERALREGPARIVIIFNGAGCGKTDLAVFSAHRLSQSFSAAQLFIRLGGEQVHDVSPEDALRELLTRLGVAADEMPARLEDRAALYRSLLPPGSLVVLDNAMSAAQVRPLLPGGAEHAVIITSRDALLELNGRHEVELGELSAEEAYALLERKLGPERTGGDPQAVRDIARSCDRLPLALQIAAALLNRRSYRSMPLADFAALLRDEKSRLDLLSSGEQAVRPSFRLSYQALGPQAQRLFRLLGPVRVPDFGHDLALAIGGAGQSRAALDELVDAYLLEPAGRDRVRFHDLMRLFAQDCAELEEADAERAAALDRAFAWCLDRAADWSRHIGPEGTQAADDKTYGGALDGFEREREVFLGAIRQAAATGRGDVPWRLTARLSGFFEVRGHWPDWLEAAQIAHDTAPPDEPRSVGVALHQLGYVQRLLRRTSEALTNEVAAVRLLRGLPGAEPDLAGALAQLGITYREAHRYDESLGVLGEALELYRGLGDRHGEGLVLRTLGHVHFWRRDLDEAGTALEEAISLLHGVGDRATEGWSRANLLSVLGAAWQDEAAQIQFIKAVELFSAIGHRQGAAWAYNHMGRIHQQYGRIPEAVECHERALEAFQFLGDRYGEGWASLHLGAARRDTGLVGEALTIFKEIGEDDGQGWAKIWLARLTADPTLLAGAIGHFATIGSLQGQGTALSVRGDLEREADDPAAARASYERALPYLETGHDPYRAALTRRGLGLLDGDEELIRQADESIRRLGAPEEEA